jgi:NitT/TauT family transport system substrate-binding protein
MTKLLAAVVAALLAGAVGAHAETNEIRVTRGAGGVGFLPLLVMEKHQLAERRAREAGLGDLKVSWLDLGGPSVVNDALLSGAAHVVPAGPPAFITVWARTRDNAKIKGVAAMTSIPMYLNTRSPTLNSIDDLTDQDKIAVTAVKVSIPSIIMQMYALKKYGADQYTRFDKYTVSLRHPDAVIALLAGRTEITAHYASPPFHQKERKDLRIRTIMTSNEVMGGPSTFTMLYATSKFRHENPKAYGAFVRGLQDAIAMINSDKQAAAQILLESPEGKGSTIEEMVEMVADPDVKFTTAPENVMKYAEFMSQVGSIKTRPENWQEMFFPEIHGQEGS